jgi:hypothetical protein
MITAGKRTKRNIRRIIDEQLNLNHQSKLIINSSLSKSSSTSKFVSEFLSLSSKSIIYYSFLRIAEFLDFAHHPILKTKHSAQHQALDRSKNSVIPCVNTLSESTHSILTSLNPSLSKYSWSTFSTCPQYPSQSTPDICEGFSNTNSWSLFTACSSKNFLI